MCNQTYKSISSNIFFLNIVFVLRSSLKFKSYQRWAKACVCQEKILTEGHWDCEDNDCDDCCYEYIYESFEETWDLTFPEECEEDEVTLYPISFYDKFQVVDETSGDVHDQHVYKTEFVSFEAFMEKYLSIWIFFNNLLT